MTDAHVTVLPTPELRGEGVVVYRCAICHELTDEPVWGVLGEWTTDTQPMILTPETRTYHPACIGEANGR